MREVDTAAQLNLAVEGVLVANHGEIVFKFDACSSEPVLAVVASSAPAWVAAIYIDVGLVVAQSEVAEGWVVDIGDLTGNTIINGLVVGLGEELGDGDVGNRDVTLILSTLHLWAAIV